MTNTNLPKPPPAPKWATLIDDRRPKFKVHNNLGHAKNAVYCVIYTLPRGGKIYEWDGNDWQEWLVVPKPSDHTCSVCGEPFVGTELSFARVDDYRVHVSERTVRHGRCSAS